MSDATAITLAKMNGLGNEIVVADLRGGRKVLTPEEARAIATRPGWHFDQLMALHDAVTPGTRALVRIYNNDGSLAGACGNGMRCVVLFDAEPAGATDARYETARGILQAVVVQPGGGAISVEMGPPRFQWQDIPLADPFHDTRHIELQIGPIDNPMLHSPSAVNVGNPHAIFWVDDVDAYDLGRFGPLLENHPIFPERANISLAQVTSRTSLRLRTWERGAGLTRACGSAACAAAVSAARLDLTGRQVDVTLPGGTLRITWRDDDQIVMEGPAEMERLERVNIEEFLRAAA